MTPFYFPIHNLSSDDMGTLINAIATKYVIENVPDNINFNLVDKEVDLVVASASKYSLFGMDIWKIFSCQEPSDWSVYGQSADEWNNFTLEELLAALDLV